ncbi:MAG: LytTR family DNA-binding domain-containing protein [Flavobacteriaceae bacterium]
MIKVIIVDDERSAIKSLEWEIKNFCKDIEVCETFTDPSDAISAINYLKPDCVFLDIEMPEMDGFQLLNSLKFRDFDLIITTAFDNYAIRAFKESAIDYLLKPIDSDDLIKSVAKIKTNKEKNTLGDELKKALETILPKENKSKIALPLPGKTVFINSSDIVYCKSDGNYTEIYFKDAKKEVLSKKLKTVEEIFQNEIFFRVHKSYLVNVDYIKELVKKDGQYLVLENGTSIPVSRTKKEALLEILSR